MFLSEPNTPAAAAFLERERAATGYVMNLERAWAWRPDIAEGFAALRSQLTQQSTLSPAEVAVLVCATAHARGDSYCALAWGTRLARITSDELAAATLRGEADARLSVREAALQRWAARVARDPNGASTEDIGALRSAGLTDQEILEATVFVGLRLAFSTINDALGARPDAALAAAAPAPVRAAIAYGRPAESG